jgi:hypothetical protein
MEIVEVHVLGRRREIVEGGWAGGIHVAPERELAAKGLFNGQLPPCASPRDCELQVTRGELASGKARLRQGCVYSALQVRERETAAVDANPTCETATEAWDFREQG